MSSRTRTGRSRRRGKGGAGVRGTRGIEDLISRRLAGLTRRACADGGEKTGEKISDKELSGAVVDISRLVTAATRLRKLDGTGRTAGGESAGEDGVGAVAADEVGPGGHGKVDTRRALSMDQYLVERVAAQKAMARGEPYDAAVLDPTKIKVVTNSGEVIPWG